MHVLQSLYEWTGWSLGNVYTIVLTVYLIVYRLNTLQVTAYENMTKSSCPIALLPKSVDWCDHDLLSNLRLPEHTVCQSSKDGVDDLVCDQGRWFHKKGTQKMYINVQSWYKNVI